MRLRNVLQAGIALVGTLTFSANALLITPNADAVSLANTILGTGITLSGTPTLQGKTSGILQTGTFTDGAAEVGFSSGIVLSTGNVNEIAGPNNNIGLESRGGGGVGDDDISTSLGGAGDADLSAISGFSTYDAAVLEFEFDLATAGDLYFNFTFGSEEYIDYIGTQYNDVFAFILDDVDNLAVIGPSNDPITINTINDLSNSAYYINNVPNSSGLPVAGLDIGFDGLTTPLTAQALGLSAGTHKIKLAVADASDGLLDAGVFIQAGTFSTEPTPVPEPATASLLLFGVLGLALIRRKK